jgi:hypothetical protein
MKGGFIRKVSLAAVRKTSREDEHGLQLQGDVGDGPDKRDQADKGRDPLALPVTGRDEIGDGGDVLRLRHPHDAGNQGITQADHEDRADIDRQEVESGMARKSHRSEEGPGRAIDR